MVAELVREEVVSVADDEVSVSPAHPDLQRKLIRALVLTEDDAEAEAMATRDARRLVPLRLVEMHGGIPTMSRELLAYLEARPSDAAVWLARLAGSDHQLAARYRAYMALRRSGVKAMPAQARLAAQWRVSDRQVRTYIARAETLIVGIVHGQLMADVRRRQAQGE